MKAAPAAAATLAAIAIATASSGGLLALAATNLAFHMTIEHVAFFSAGGLFAIAAGYLWPGLKALGRSRLALALGAAVALLVLWHYPPLFAASVAHEELHLAQHASFVAVGALAAVAIRAMPVSYFILFVFSTGGAMALFGILLALSSQQMFFPYSVESHREAGNVMVALSIAVGVLVLPAFVINRSLRHELKA